MTIIHEFPTRNSARQGVCKSIVSRFVFEILPSCNIYHWTLQFASGIESNDDTTVAFSRKQQNEGGSKTHRISNVWPLKEIVNDTTKSSRTRTTTPRRVVLPFSPSRYVPLVFVFFVFLQVVNFDIWTKRHVN